MILRLDVSFLVWLSKLFKQESSCWCCKTSSCVISYIFSFKFKVHTQILKFLREINHDYNLIIFSLRWHVLSSFDFNEPAYIIRSEYDPDINFYCEKSLFSDFWCKYYSENTFNDKMCSFLLNNTQSFSMCHINLRNINANLNAFECYLDMLLMDFSIMGITETWLTNYETEEQHRDHKSGGGVALFIRNGTQYKIRKDLQVFNDYCESVFVEI